MSRLTMCGAECRGCRKKLFGTDYCYGGDAYLPDAFGNRTDRRAKVNYYGGYVCSRECDVRACLELERSMPGHGWSQKEIGSDARRRVELNWSPA